MDKNGNKQTVDTASVGNIAVGEQQIHDSNTVFKKQMTELYN